MAEMSKRKYKSFGYFGNNNRCTAKNKSGSRCKNFCKKHISRALCSEHWIKYKEKVSKRRI